MIWQYIYVIEGTLSSQVYLLFVPFCCVSLQAGIFKETDGTYSST